MTQSDFGFTRSPSVIVGDAHVGTGRSVGGVSDHELSGLLRARIPEAWETLFERHYDRIYRYALAKLGDAHRAEDAASATFQRALDGIDRYTFTGRPVLAWLYGIAGNIVREEQRSQTRRLGGGLLSPLRRGNNGTGPKANDADRFAKDNTDEIVRWLDLREDLKHLTDLQREVIILRCVAGLSGAETARAIDRPESAVYALQARAVATLRRLRLS